MIFNVAVTSSVLSGSSNPISPTMARVYADVNQQMPRSYWDYDSVNITWGVLENYEVVRKIGTSIPSALPGSPVSPAHR